MANRSFENRRAKNASAEERVNIFDMELNRIQILIFEKLSKEKGLDPDEYIKKYSLEFIKVERDGLQNLSEEEADMWINVAYLLSLL